MDHQDLYDNQSHPYTSLSRTPCKSSNPTDRSSSFAPRINILLASPRGLVLLHLPALEDIPLWMAPRWLFIRPAEESVSAAPSSLILREGKFSRFQLRVISQLSGEATIPEDIWKDYEVWSNRRRFVFRIPLNPAPRRTGIESPQRSFLKLADDLPSLGFTSAVLFGCDAWHRCEG